MTQHDLIIRGCSVFDGTGTKPVTADVAIDDDRIVAVGTLEKSAGVEIDGHGLSMAPGFIDVHSHDDFAALLEPELTFKLLQGVTTEVVGNCGMGAAPFRPARELAQTFHPGCELPEWEGYEGYLRALEQAPPSANIAVLAGHGCLRAEAMGDDNQRPAERSELLRMQELLAEALEAGVLGLSTGLIYEPGRHATGEELSALTRQLGSGGLYTTHIRNEADQLLEAVEEAIALCEPAGVSLQLSHHKACGRNNWGRVSASLGLVDAARQRGVDLWLDQYPYTAGSTILTAVMASGSLQGRGRMGELRAEDVVLAAVAGAPELEGCHLGELAQRWSVDASAAAARVLEMDPNSWVVVHNIAEQDVRQVMDHPASMFGSDGIPQTSGRPHPRLYGTFPRVLGHYARSLGLLSLERAIYKMTALPAQRFGLQWRGRIAPGYFADLVLFDADSILDRATFDDPRQPPSGIHAVYVNGRAVVRNGQHLGTRPGRALRRVA